VHYWWVVNLYSCCEKHGGFWRFLKKLKIEPPYNLAIPLLGGKQRKKKTKTFKNICTLLFIAVLFIITKIWKQLKCPSNE